MIFSRQKVWLFKTECLILPLNLAETREMARILAYASNNNQNNQNQNQNNNQVRMVTSFGQRES